MAVRAECLFQKAEKRCLELWFESSRPLFSAQRKPTWGKGAGDDRSRMAQRLVLSPPVRGGQGSGHDPPTPPAHGRLLPPPGRRVLRPPAPARRGGCRAVCG